MPVEKPCLLIMLLISMPQRGIHNLRHKSVHDLTETLLSEMCHNTSTEPALQPLTGEILRLRTAKRDDDARLDIKASGFWRAGQEAFLMSGFLP